MIVAVGGHSRNVGKTSVAAGLIYAFRRYPWTAIKISSHRHPSLSNLKKDNEKNFCDVHEESNPEGSSDTSRFLAAGAGRSLWMQIEDDRSDTAQQLLMPILRSCPFVLVESNQIVRLIRPDVFIMVLRFDTMDFKDSARACLRQADAVVAVNPDLAPPPWEGISDTLSNIPQFITADPCVMPAGLIDFVQSRLPGD